MIKNILAVKKVNRKTFGGWQKDSEVLNKLYTKKEAEKLSLSGFEGQLETVRFEFFEIKDDSVNLLSKEVLRDDI